MLTLLIISVLTSLTFCDEANNLVSVVVIYRHGDRTPIDPYPTDPYGNLSYWPVGWGELTNTGKMQHYNLGKWLRDRYDGFLPSTYSENDIYVRSTDVDRTLMSAAANLAGLYPPQKSQIWNPNIQWQPIPIHTEFARDDNMLSMGKPCPKYVQLTEELYQSDFFKNISIINHDLYQYVSNFSGVTISTPVDVEYVYNTLTIEEIYNFTLPNWTKEVYPDKLQRWADMSFAIPSWTKDLARFRIGPLFNQIIENFVNTTDNVPDTPKFFVYSAHDTTIASVLNTLGAFEYHCPPYASTIIMELRRNVNGTYFVNVFYKNSSQPINITINNCGFNCDLAELIDILEPVLITPQQWDIECDWSLIEYIYIKHLEYVVFISFSIVMLLFIFTTLLAVKYRRSLQNSRLADYMQLPNDEVA